MLQPKLNLICFRLQKIWLLVAVFSTKMMTRNGGRKVQTTVLESVTGTVTRKSTSEFSLRVSPEWGNAVISWK